MTWPPPAAASRRARRATASRAQTVDGNDALAVYDAMERAVVRARAGEGPSLIEARTVRFMGHFEGDPQGYRSRGEVEGGRQRDPIARLRAHLEEAKLLDAAHAARVAAAIEAEVQDAVDFAESSPLPARGGCAPGSLRPLSLERLAGCRGFRHGAGGDPDGGHGLRRRAEPRPARGDAARPARLLHRRRHRPRRALRRHQGPGRGVRPGASAERPDLRGGHRGLGHGRGHHGSRAGGGHALRRLRHLRDGRGRQPDRQEPLHVRRPDLVPADAAHAVRHWEVSRRAPLELRRGLVRQHPRPQGLHSRRLRPTRGACSRRRSAIQTPC